MTILPREAQTQRRQRCEYDPRRLCNSFAEGSEMIGCRRTVRLRNGATQRVTIIDYHSFHVAVRRWPWSRHFWVSVAQVMKESK